MIKEKLEGMVSEVIGGAISKAVDEAIEDKSISGVINRAMLGAMDAYRDHVLGVREKMLKGFDTAIEYNDMEEVKRMTEVFRNFEYVSSKEMSL